MTRGLLLVVSEVGGTVGMLRGEKPGTLARGSTGSRVEVAGDSIVNINSMSVEAFYSGLRSLSPSRHCYELLQLTAGLGFSPPSGSRLRGNGTQALTIITR